MNNIDGFDKFFGLVFIISWLFSFGFLVGFIIEGDYLLVCVSVYLLLQAFLAAYTFSEGNKK